MVLFRHHRPELLAVGSIRPKLALPMVKSARSSLANCHTRCILLHWRVGRSSMDIRHSLETPRMDTANLRYRVGCASVVSNAVVYVEYRSIHPMGWWAGCKYICRAITLALARCSRCISGCRHVSPRVQYFHSPS